MRADRQILDPHLAEPFQGLFVGYAWRTRYRFAFGFADLNLKTEQ